MSAEPGRRKAYSEDLRWKIVWLKLSKDLTFNKIASCLTISVGTAYNIWRLFVLTDEVEPSKSSRMHTRMLNNSEEIFVVSLIMQNSSLTLREVCDAVYSVTGTSVSPPTICRLLKRHGLSRKKIQLTASQRCVHYRGSFIARASLFSKP